MRTTKRDRDEFASFCANATETQLANILERERAARRKTYATIAERETDRRRRSHNANARL